MDKTFILVLMVVFLLFISGLGGVFYGILSGWFTGSGGGGPPPQFNEHAFIVAEKVSSLPRFENRELNASVEYVEFAAQANVVITILNDETNVFEIPELEGTGDEYDRFSKLVTEFTPLVDNYNKLIDAAGHVKRGRPETLDDFYVASSEFGVEVALIACASYYSPSYKVVGFIYRKSGFNRFAFNHPQAVAAALSHAHWFIRNKMVEHTTEGLYFLTEFVKDIVIELDDDVLSKVLYELQEIDPRVFEEVLSTIKEI